MSTPRGNNKVNRFERLAHLRRIEREGKLTLAQVNEMIRILRFNRFLRAEIHRVE